MLNPAALSLAAALLCISCSNRAIEASQSLVGATDIPSEEALSRETLLITRGANDWGGNRLYYELRNDDLLTITHTYFHGRVPAEKIIEKETVHLPARAAAEIRRLIWRVRPAQLENQGLEKDGVRPVGCERQGPHDFGEVGIGFIDEGSQKGIKDDQVGIFELPTRDSCHTPAATEARKVVRQALKLVPEMKATASYERTF